ncbi:MAG: ATP-dependent helicase HrpB [Bdellovibrionota bacterium]
MNPQIPLPLNDAWPALQEALAKHKNLVLVAEPGAGKTTRFPPLLLKSGLIDSNRSIIMLEPRRLAARAAASRIASEEGWSVGEEIGYQVRFENRIGPRSRIQVLTEGLLMRKFQKDPELSNVGAVILDEFHERSIHTDVAIGLLLEMQELSRPDLRIIVMSATLDAEKVSRYLGDCPIVRVPGRHFDVKIQNHSKPLNLKTDRQFVSEMADAVVDVATGKRERAGDILVFLPGAREIREVLFQVQPRLPSGFAVVPLHGNLNLKDQDTAIRPLAGHTKIVLSTNIAESSLTIDGMGTVIDSGLARIVRTDAAGFSRLQLTRISMASATQRAGRAGRQFAGLCYRMWSKLDEPSMPELELPEILRTDLTDTILFLVEHGIKPETFSWFEAPSPVAIKETLKTLQRLGLIESNSLTPLGRAAAKLPLPVRAAKLLIEAAQMGRAKLGAELAAILTERDVLGNSRSAGSSGGIESDILIRLSALRGSGGDPAARDNALKVARQLEDQVKALNLPKRTANSDKTGASESEDVIATKLILFSHSDRVCRRRRENEPSALMVGGKGVQIAPSSSVQHAEFFVALATMEGKNSSLRSDPLISMASKIEKGWLEESFPGAVKKVSRTRFDSETDAVISENFLGFEDLPLQEPHLGRANSDDAFPILVEACMLNWDKWFGSNEEIVSVVDRIEFLKKYLGADGIDDFDADRKRTALEEVCFGSVKLSEVKARDLRGAITRTLSPQTVSLLSNDAPEKIRVPSGSEIKVHYPSDRQPYIEVRIQEVFGWTSSPKLARGAVNLQVHLLGPNYRPVQVTSDLASFWRTGYLEVRKELRSRYPKHSWPEDPLTAKAEAKGRPRK